MKKKVFRVLMTMLAVFSWVIIGSAYAADTEPIKIGHIDPLSGGYASYGIEKKIGLEIAIDEINKAGGILGRQLKLISRDSQLKPDNALREAKDLVFNEKVFWLQGIVSSAVANAVSEFTKKEKQIFWITEATSAELTADRGHRYVFRMNTPSHPQMSAIAAGAVKMFGPLKRVYAVMPDYGYGRTSWKIFWPAYKRLVPDAQALGEAWIPTSATDVTGYISKVMAAKPDFVINMTFGGSLLAWYQQAVPFGYYEKISESTGLVTAQVANGLAKAALASGLIPKNVAAASVYDGEAIQNPISRRFMNEMKQRDPSITPAWAACDYTVPYFMKAAIEKVGSLDIEKVIDALEGMKLNTVVGETELRACDHQALWPWFVHKVGIDKDKGFVGMIDPIMIESRNEYLSCEQIKKLRKK